MSQQLEERKCSYVFYDDVNNNGDLKMRLLWTGILIFLKKSPTD